MLIINYFYRQFLYLITVDIINYSILPTVPFARFIKIDFKK